MSADHSLAVILTAGDDSLKRLNREVTAPGLPRMARRAVGIEEGSDVTGKVGSGGEDSRDEPQEEKEAGHAGEMSISRRLSA